MSKTPENMVRTTKKKKEKLKRKEKSPVVPSSENINGQLQKSS